VSKDALRRHSQEHLPKLLVEARQAVEVAESTDLLARIESLQERTLELLHRAEQEGELRVALAGVREARQNLELIGRLTKELDEQPKVNILVSQQWIEIRGVLVSALSAFPEAKQTVAAKLLELKGGGLNGSG
jgi:hypothetical protein